MQETKLSVGVYYCGGCNPYYDRAAMLCVLEDRYQQICFIPAEQGKDYTHLLILNGCQRACASYNGLHAKHSLMLTSAAMEKAQTVLEEWMRECGSQ